MKVDSISKAIFFVTVRLTTTMSDGSPSGGTAFLYGRPNPDGQQLLLVTNRHVVEDAVSGRVALVEGEVSEGSMQPKLGATIDVDIDGFPEMWRFHSDPAIDLAVAPFGGLVQHLAEEGKPVFIQTIGDDLFPSADQMAELGGIESVTFVGYPSGLYDTEHGTPIARRGWTATPIALDYGGKPMFVVDAPVFGGSSGSPVFILNEGMYTTPTGTVIGSRVMFLGVLAAVHQEHALAQVIETQGNPAVVYQRLLNLGLVFRADSLRPLLDEALGGK